MLNANTSTWNCDVYTSNSDTYVNFEKVSTGVYYIRLKSHPERYLTAGGTKSGSDVSWEKLSTTTAGKKAQQWKVTATSLPTVYTRVTSGADSLGDDQMEQMRSTSIIISRRKDSPRMLSVGFLEI